MKHFEEFLEHLKTKHYSKSTIENYFYILKRARNYFAGKGIIDEKLITETDLVDYITYLKNEVKSDWIYYRSIMSLKVYFKYLEDENIIFISPMNDFDLPKDVKNPTKILTKDEIREALEKIDTKEDQGIRARTILELLYSSALRPSEITNIKLTDIDFNKKILFIRLSKNKKDRVVPVGDKAIYWLTKYIKEVRPKYVTEKSDNYIFISHYVTGKKIHYRALYYLLRRAFDRYKIKRFKPFSLRPSSATHLLQNGMGILHIKELLGHSNVLTTKIYLRVNERDLRNELTKKHPRFNKNNGGQK